MQKITLFFLAVMTAFVVSSCKKTEEVAPATVVGKWNLVGITGTTDLQTFTATNEEIKKNVPNVTIAAFAYEFLSDGTFNVLDDKGVKDIEDSGKYVLTTDKKTATLTTNKDTNGNIYIYIFEISTLSNTELKLSSPKLTKVNNKFTATSTSEAVSAFYTQIAILAKGGTVANDYNKATTIQAVLNFKK